MFFWKSSFADSRHLWGRPYVNQVYDFALDTKVKDQAHKHWALFWGSPHQPQQYQWCIYKRQTERSQWIFNESSVWNFEQAQIDSWFFNGARGSFQNCWLFLPRWANIHSRGKGGKKGGHDTDKFLTLSPHHTQMLRSQYPVHSVSVLLHVTWCHRE